MTCDLLGLHHTARLVLTAPSLPQDCVNLVNEDDARLQLPCQTEDGVHQLVAVTIPFFCESRDVEVDEACAGLVCESLCQHSLSTPWRPIQKHTAGRAQQRRRMRVEVGHGQRIDDRFLQLLNDRVQPADVVKRHWNLLRRNDLHSDRLLVAVQLQLLYARAPPPRVLLVFAVVLTITLPPLAAEYGIEFPSRGG